MKPGEAKWWMERIRGYATIPTQIAGLLASLKILGFSLYWGLALVPLGYLVYRADRKWVAKEEAEMGFKFGKKILEQKDEPPKATVKDLVDYSYTLRKFTPIDQ